MDTFSADDWAAGRKLRTGELLFSEGTYQIAVGEYWPFLQLSSTGQVLDAFCTCKKAETEGHCPHLAAAYLRIFEGRPEPLHVRFRNSFWYQLGWVAFERIGSDLTTFHLTPQGSFDAYDETNRRLFSFKPLEEKMRRRLKKLLLGKRQETEETSLKFSKLSSEELLLWRQGRPSEQLRFELSFWSDLAKEWMQRAEQNVPYHLLFDPEEELPHTLRLYFPDLEIECYLALVDWPRLIPTLHQVRSPIRAHLSTVGTLRAIRYNPDAKCFDLEYVERPPVEEQKEVHSGIAVGEWVYVPREGFYPRSRDPFLESKEIPFEKIDAFLSRHEKVVANHLIGDTLHLGTVRPHSQLSIGEDQSLIIRSYLFSPGDLEQPGAACFGRWVYLPLKGFYCLEEGLLQGETLMIPKQQVSGFVSRHRAWLQAYEGFETHMSTIESRLIYLVSEQGLEFSTKLDYLEEEETVCDYGEWIYLRGKGFYARSSERFGSILKAGLTIAPPEISRFIDQNSDELEAVSGFFASRCPLERVGLDIGFAESGHIQVTPRFFFEREQHVRLFGDYTYVHGEGFARIPPEKRLPEAYRVPKKIDKREEPYFVGYEIDLLSTYLLSIDPKIKKPRSLQLRLNQLKRDRKARTGEWIVSLQYESNLGRLSPHAIWQALQEGRSYLFSDAGLLFLRNSRFEWFKQKKKKRWIKGGESLRLTTLEFLQLNALEELSEPEKGKSRTLYRQFLSFEPPHPIDLTGLQSELRPYQQTGANWLWALSSYGLSGLLCDEMGLGKTHQAMALIAGLKNAQEPVKILVACPTSVIYHWQQLLQRFFPAISSHFFYGPQRIWSTECELILTSYGVLRSDKSLFQTQSFDLAVFDEIQVAKNEKSQVHKALTLVKAKMRLGLTGTPVENRLLELKALFDLVLPDYLPPAAVFRSLFVNPIEKQGDDQKRLLLKRLVKPFILRRKKSEVLTELPEKIEEISYCDLSQEQQSLYKEIFRSHEEQILEKLYDPKNPLPFPHLFALLSKLKQVCDHPVLITKDTLNYPNHSSGKWDLFTALLSEIRDSGQKVVVFTQYLAMLDILEHYLTSEGIAYATIRGSTQDRREQVARFQEDPNCEVFLGSLQAAGVGIDLVAASVVIHYDRWWNPAKENQATDRVHRIGQKRGVQVFKLVTRNSIEEHVDALIESKQRLASGIIDFDHADQLKTLSRSEVVQLMQQIRQDIETGAQ